MDIQLEPGTYVVAVSGGVDSMALIDVVNKLRNKRRDNKYKITIAHFDHGIRKDSRIERQLVADVATRYGLPYVYQQASLGSSASEEQARKARYEFLHKVRKAAEASAILTAHHHDDVIETAVFNLFRGTGRKGLSSLSNTEYVVRPFLHLPKSALRSYAEQQGLVWREDPTNKNTEYTRNYIRHRILPKLTMEQKSYLLEHINKARKLNEEIDATTLGLIKSQKNITKIDRKWFRNLPYSVSKEVMATWLRVNNITFDKKLIDYLVIAAKTFAFSKAAHVDKNHYLLIEPDNLALYPFER